MTATNVQPPSTAARKALPWSVRRTGIGLALLFLLLLSASWLLTPARSFATFGDDMAGPAQFSHDGSVVVAHGANTGLWVFDTTTQKVLANHPLKRGEPFLLSSDGRSIAYQDALRDVLTGQAVGKLDASLETFNPDAKTSMSPDGKWEASAINAGVRLESRTRGQQFDLVVKDDCLRIIIDDGTHIVWPTRGPVSTKTELGMTEAQAVEILGVRCGQYRTKKNRFVVHHADHVSFYEAYQPPDTVIDGSHRADSTNGRKGWIGDECASWLEFDEEGRVKSKGGSPAEFTNRD